MSLVEYTDRKGSVVPEYPELYLVLIVVYPYCRYASDLDPSLSAIFTSKPYGPGPISAKFDNLLFTCFFLEKIF